MHVRVQFPDKMRNRLRNKAHLHRQTEQKGKRNKLCLGNRRTE